MSCKKFLIKLFEHYSNKRQKKYFTELQKRSCDELQVMEFDGNLYLSYRGCPLIDVNSLKGTIPEMLVQARDVWVKHHVKSGVRINTGF